MKERVAVMVRYTRSLDDNLEQLEAIDKLCDEKGYSIVHKIANIIMDEVWTEDDVKRIVAELEKMKVKKVVVAELWCLGYGANDILAIAEAFVTKKITVVFAEDGLETLDEDGKETPRTAAMLHALRQLAKSQEKRALNAWLKHKERRNRIESIRKKKVYS